VVGDEAAPGEGEAADGGGGGEDAGGGEDGGGTGDGGTMTGDCAPADVELMETCPAFTACGGAVAGAWCYTGICIEEEEIIDPSESIGTCTGADLVLSDFSGTVTGRVEFVESPAGDTVTRSATTHTEASIGIPSSCVGGLGATVCAGTVTMALEMALGDGGSASCAATTDGGCDCDVSLDTSIDSADGYSIMGNRIRVGMGSSARMFDYCVEGDGSFRFRETTADAQEPGVQTISPE